MHKRSIFSHLDVPASKACPAQLRPSCVQVRMIRQNESFPSIKQENIVNWILSKSKVRKPCFPDLYLFSLGRDSSGPANNKRNMLIAYIDKPNKECSFYIFSPSSVSFLCCFSFSLYFVEPVRLCKLNN